MINPLSNESSEHNGSYNNYSNKNNEQMILTFSDGRQISYDTYQLREISPKFVANHMGEPTITLPDWITVEDLSAFISIYQKGIEYITEYHDREQLL